MSNIKHTHTYIKACAQTILRNRDRKGQHNNIDDV